MQSHRLTHTAKRVFHLEAWNQEYHSAPACQGIHIYLIFDDREVELPKFIADYVMYKLDKKAHANMEKKLRNETKKQDYLGMRYVN